MVAKCTKPEIKTSFGLKCKSPKATEKKAAKREKRALMCDFGREASPKAGLVGDRWDIASEHEIHAQNGESAGSDIIGAFSRENPCFRLFGGGGGTRTPVRRMADKSIYERIPHFDSRALDSCGQDSLAPVRKSVLVSWRTLLDEQASIVTPGSVPLAWNGRMRLPN